MEKVSKDWSDLSAGRVALVLLLVAGFYIWRGGYLLSMGQWELLEGQVACPTEDAVVTVRGARLMGGVTAQGRVAARHGCVWGARPVRLERKARGGNLVHRIRIDDRVMYADRDSIARSDER